MRAAYWAAYQAELERLDARQCKTGYGCGSSCISLAKDCRKEPKAATGKERLRRISQLAGGEIGEGKGLGRLRQSEAAAKLEELQGKRGERARDLNGQRQQRQPKSDIEYYQQFRQTAEIPDKEVNWGSMRGRKNGRRPGGVVAGAMSDAPRGTKKYPDFAMAKGVTPAIRDELMGLEDEDKRAVIGALQAGWSEDRAFKLVYSVGQASSPSVLTVQASTTQEVKTPKTRKLRQQFEPLTEADRIAPDPPKPVATPKPEPKQELTSNQRLLRYQLEETRKASTPVDETGRVRTVNSVGGKDPAAFAYISNQVLSTYPSPFATRKEAIEKAKWMSGLDLSSSHERDEYYISKMGGKWWIRKFRGELVQVGEDAIQLSGSSSAEQPKQPGRQPAASQASEARDKEQSDLEVVKRRLKRAQGQLTEAQKLYKLYGSESQRQRVEQLQKAVESYKRVLSPEYRLNRGQTVEEISRTAGGGRYSTNPKQTAAEKAASTRLAKQQRLNELGRRLAERGLTTAEKAEYESLQPKRRRRTDSIYQSAYEAELQALRRRAA